MQYDKEFSALDNLVKLSGNITISLEDQLSNLTLRQTEIGELCTNLFESLLHLYLICDLLYKYININTLIYK